MNQNRKWKKRTMSAIAIAASATLCQMNVFAAGEEIFKDESVYVNMDAKGNPQEITVSDWLKHAENEKQVKDASSLSEIKNIKGDETFQKNGEKLVWSTDGEDIYYQGKTDKTLPVTMKLTYELNGKEMEPENLKGKSGHLKIKLEYKNNVKQEVEIDGKKENLYVPFVVLSGGIFPTDTFTNVQVDNGKVISDGSKAIVAGAVLPGMSENLGLDKMEDVDLEIPESITIEADVTDCEMEPIFTVVSAQVFADLGLDKIDSLDEMQKAMDELTDASLKLADGSNSLADGLLELKEKSFEFTAGVDELTEGAVSLHDGAGTLEEGLSQYTKAEGTLAEGIRQYTNGAGTLSSGTKAYVEGVGKIAKAAKEQLPLIGQNLETLSQGLEELDGKLTDKTNGLVASSQKMQTGISQISDGFSNLSKVVTDKGLSGIADSLMTVKEEAVDKANVAVKESKAGIETARSAVTSGYTDLNGQIAKKNEELQAFGNSMVKEAQEQVDVAILTANQKLDQETKEVDEILKEAGVEDAVREKVAAALGKAKTTAPKIEGDTKTLGQVQMPTVSVDGKTVPVSMALKQVADGLTPVIGSEGLSRASQVLLKTSEELKDKAAQLDDAPIAKLSAGIGQLKTGIDAFAEESAPMITNTVTTIAQNTSKLAKSAENGSEQLIMGLNELQKNDAALKKGVELLEMSGKDLVIGSAKLSENNAKLNGGAAMLSRGTKSLLDGTGTLSSGTVQLLDGVSKLSDGANTLKEGMDEFQKQGIKKLADVFGDDFESLKNKLKGMQKLAEDYDSYSGISDEMEGEVKFVMETKEIK